MLVAYEKGTQKQVSLLNKQVSEMKQLKGKNYICPACKQEVILKSGPIKIAHFAHKKQASCWFEFEAETQEHLHLKRLFADWCQKEQLSYEVEAYLSELKQRPDLLIGRLALEIQCSPLSVKRLAERTKKYQENGYQVIWICGQKLTPTLQLTELIRQFSYYSSNLGFYLWTADWQTERLALYFHLEETQTNRLYFSQKSWAFQEKRLVEVFAYPKNGKIYVERKYLLKPLLKAYYHQLLQQFSYQNKQLYKIQNSLYSEGYHILQLPEWFYYPGLRLFEVKSSDLILKQLIWSRLQELPSKKYLKAELFSIIKEQLEQSKKYLRTFPNIEEAVLITRCAGELLRWLVDCEAIQESQEFYQIVPATKSRSKQALLKWVEKNKNQCIFSVTPNKL